MNSITSTKSFLPDSCHSLTKGNSRNFYIAVLFFPVIPVLRLYSENFML